MDTPARGLFDSLTSYQAVQQLIDEGEAEGQFLECKAPASPQLTREMKAKLAISASGFANSGGGLIVWGVGTTRHEATGLDVLSQIEPIGNVRRLAQQIDVSLAGLTMPALPLVPTRVLHERRGDTRGLAITFIPPTPGDPVQSTIDRQFHFRSADSFTTLPYEILKRMFTGAESPSLHPLLDASIVKVEGAFWEIPIAIANESTASARDSTVVVTLLNKDACDSVSGTDGFRDVSHLNPGRTVLTSRADVPIFRGFNQVMGSVRVRMRTGKRPRRTLRLRVELFADRMRGKSWTLTLQLAKKGFSIKDVKETFVY